VPEGVGCEMEHFGIEELRTAPRSPWQNAYAERLVGSIDASASIT
jgi:hypothetical protein